MKKFNKAFTLAEIMIVLSVIGIITAILLPVAFQATPNEDVMLFKNTYNALGSAIREIATSDKYYLEGDLNKKANGNAADSGFFCNVLADVLNTKSASCSGTSGGSATANTKANIDAACTGKAIPANAIVLNNKSKIYRAGGNTSFPVTTDSNGFYNNYIVLCFSVNDSERFGLGVRVDGKIMTGTKIDTWINKSIQDKD